MRALLKPPIGKSKIGEAFVTVYGPTGRNRVKVKFSNGKIIAVDPYRLFDPTDRTRALSATEIERAGRDRTDAGGGLLS